MVAKTLCDAASRLGRAADVQNLSARL